MHGGVVVWGVPPFLAFYPSKSPLVFPLQPSPKPNRKILPDLLSVFTVCFQFGTSTLHSFSCGIVSAIRSLALHSLCRDSDFQYPVYQVCRHFQNLLPCDPPLQLRLSNWPFSSSYVIKPRTPRRSTQLNHVMLA